MSDLNVTNLRATNIVGKTQGTAPNLLNGVVVSGVATASGGFKIGISSAGEEITPGPITELNFVGAGNTFNVDGTRVDISISGSGGGVSETGITTGYIWSNPNIISESIDLTQPDHNYGMFGPITVSVGSTITVGVGNTFTVV